MTKYKNFLKKISQGSIKYEDPKKLDLKFVDIKIRKTIKNINSSDWCKTLWSCQGHKEKSGAYVLPYITFMIRSDNVRDFLNIIFDTLPIYKSKSFPIAPSCSFSINRGFSNKEFTIISIYWCKNYLENNFKSDFYLNLFLISKKIKGFKC